MGSAVYDNWEKLVAATLRWVEFRELALAPSRETSFSSSISTDIDSSVDFSSYEVEDFSGGHYFNKSIRMARQVIEVADKSEAFRPECLDLKSKAGRIVSLLRVGLVKQAYERPAVRIMGEMEIALKKALALLLKCRKVGLVRRVFFIIPLKVFHEMSSQLENSIYDVSWLLRISAPVDVRDDVYLGLPPVVANEPILGIIWEQIIVLCNSDDEARSEAAATLVSLAQDNYRHAKLIIEEEAIFPLLKLLEKGRLDGRDNAARAIGLLGRDPESVELMIDAGVCTTFNRILTEAPMKIQATVAWAISAHTANHPGCRHLFARHNIFRLLISHLAFETVQEHSKYAVSRKVTTMHTAVVLARSYTGNEGLVKGRDLEDEKNLVSRPLGPTNPNQMYVEGVKGSAVSHDNQQNILVSVADNKSREMEDHATKARMKAMTAKALRHLAAGNSAVCRSITESTALLCFAVLMGKGPEEVKYECAMALMEITAVAEEDTDLRRSAFRPNSPACKALVDQLYRVVEEGESNLLLPCVKAIGNLARTFKVTETRMISPLVNLLDERDDPVLIEACVALTKFACTSNFLCMERSKAIIDAGGAKHLVQLAYFGEENVKRCAVVLLCYIAMQWPDSERLAEAGAPSVLEWASKQNIFIQVDDVELLMEAIMKIRAVSI